MKIISKTKDYYDYYGQIYGVDDSIVYKRNPSVIDIRNDYRYNNISYYFIENLKDRNIRVTVGCIFFCDTGYPMIEVIDTSNVYPFTAEYSYYYNIKDFLETWDSVLNMHYYDKGRIQRRFSELPKLKLNSDFKSPQIYIDSYNICLDIRLKDFEFQRVLSPEQAYQRVAMFMAAKPDVPQTVPTEMHRFEAKGFDKKTSFRKQKED